MPGARFHVQYEDEINPKTKTVVGFCAVIETTGTKWGEQKVVARCDDASWANSIAELLNTYNAK